jgi:prepilin-type N-terminal cleavage/methylation domain-containing protein
MINDQSGFTLPELILSITLTSVLVGLIMFFTFSFWQYSYILQADQETFTERLNATDYLREVLGTSSGIISQNSIPDANVGNPDTSISSGLYWKVLHAIPGNIAVNSSGDYTPLAYFKRLSISTSNQVILNGTQPYEDEYILYLYGPTNSLQLRSLANTNAPSNRLLTSCPLAQASSSCPADKVLISNIASIDKRFFSRSGSLIDWTSIFDSNTNSYAGPDNQAIEVIELTLNVSKKAVFQTTNSTQSSTIIRIALRNI